MTQLKYYDQSSGQWKPFINNASDAVDKTTAQTISGDKTFTGEVDLSGAEVKLPTPAYFVGGVGNLLSAGDKPISATSSKGFTLTNSNTQIRCDIPGVYFVFARQLISTNANQIYFSITKNGSKLAYAYPKPNVSTQDVITFTTVDLAENDYISINQDKSIGANWTAQHTSILIQRVY